jgi:hypothetical protein
MRRVVVVLAGVLAIAAGVWAWHSAVQGQVEQRFTETSTLFTGGDPYPYASVADALASFGGSFWCHRQLRIPPKSLVLTDEESPEFGATVSPREVHSRWHDYDIWKDGVVVVNVTFRQHPNGWRIAGLRACDDLVGETYGWPDVRRVHV